MKKMEEDDFSNMNNLSELNNLTKSQKNLNPIPERLKDYRFCKVIGKRPFENGWQTKPYAIDDPEFQLWLNKGNNYGVLGGYNGLWPWDFDNLEARHLLLEYLPDTFQVKSRRGSHHYFKSDENGIFTAGVNWKGTRAIDITGFGRQVVGPGSIHPESRKPYFVIADKELAYLDVREARKILHDILGWNEENKLSLVIPRPQGRNDRIVLSELVEVLTPYWARNTGTYYNFTGAISGFIAWNTGTQQDAEFVISELCKKTGKGCNRIRDIKFTFNSYQTSEKHVLGEPALKKILEDLEGMQ